MAEQVTRLYYNGKLMNTITSSSLFRTIPRAKVSTPKQREAVANELKQGWVQNAGYDNCLFCIEHGDADPIVFSKMTNDILRKSREKQRNHLSATDKQT